MKKENVKIEYGGIEVYEEYKEKEGYEEYEEKGYEEYEICWTRMKLWSSCG